MLLSDNNDFSVIEEEGQEKFQCDNCDFKTDKVISMKRHITAQHIMKASGKKRKSMASAKVETNTKEAKIDDLTDSIMDNLGEEYTSTQADIDNMDKLLDKYESKLEDNDKEESVLEMKTIDDTKDDNDISRLVELEEKYEAEKQKKHSSSGNCQFSY